MHEILSVVGKPLGAPARSMRHIDDRHGQEGGIAWAAATGTTNTKATALQLLAAMRARLVWLVEKESKLSLLVDSSLIQAHNKNVAWRRFLFWILNPIVWHGLQYLRIL